MVIMKLSSSKKQLQVIDEEGVVFGTSVTFLKGLLEGRSPHNFIMMTRMPFKVSKGRFKPSPVYVPDTGEKELYEETVDSEKSNADAYNPELRKKQRQKKVFTDKEVW